jgi:hypothetical protein
MAYDSALTITIPASLYDVACAISPGRWTLDLGGAEQSYGPRTKLRA